MNYRELQQRLKDMGLNAKGSKAELEARLYANSDPQITPEEDCPTGFVFVGNGDSDPAYISMGGYMFKLNGRAVPVAEPFATRLRGNNHFKEV